MLRGTNATRAQRALALQEDALYKPEREEENRGDDEEGNKQLEEEKQRIDDEFQVMQDQIQVKKASSTAKGRRKLLTRYSVRR
jgi:hypothetical protein